MKRHENECAPDLGGIYGTGEPRDRHLSLELIAMGATDGEDDRALAVPDDRQRKGKVVGEADVELLFTVRGEIELMRRMSHASN